MLCRAAVALPNQRRLYGPHRPSIYRPTVRRPTRKGLKEIGQLEVAVRRTRSSLAKKNGDNTVCTIVSPNYDALLAANRPGMSSH